MRAGGGRGRSPPQMPAPPEPAAAAAAALGAFQGALTWDAGRPAGFLRAGRRGRVGAGNRGRGRAPGRPGGAGTLASQPFPSLPCAGGGLTTPESLLISAGPLPSEDRLKERAPFGQGLREGSRRGQKEQSWRADFPAKPPPPKWLPGAHPAPTPLRLVWPGWRGWLWASDTLESPRSELRAWPPSQANSREVGGAA